MLLRLLFEKVSGCVELVSGLDPSPLVCGRQTFKTTYVTFSASVRKVVSDPLARSVVVARLQREGHDVNLFQRHMHLRLGAEIVRESCMIHQS